MEYLQVSAITRPQGDVNIKGAAVIAETSCQQPVLKKKQIQPPRKEPSMAATAQALKAV